MKFYALTAASTDKGSLETQYRDAAEIGIIRLGENCLFFRRSLRKYYIPYEEITRCFRRVVKVASGKGEMLLEHLVICVGDEEVAQIQLPGTAVAKEVMKQLEMLAPHARFGSAG